MKYSRTTIKIGADQGATWAIFGREAEILEMYAQIAPPIGCPPPKTGKKQISEISDFFCESCPTLNNECHSQPSILTRIRRLEPFHRQTDRQPGRQTDVQKVAPSGRGWGLHRVALSSHDRQILLSSYYPQARWRPWWSRKRGFLALKRP